MQVAWFIISSQLVHPALRAASICVHPSFTWVIQSSSPVTFMFTNGFLNSITVKILNFWGSVLDAVSHNLHFWFILGYNDCCLGSKILERENNCQWTLDPPQHQVPQFNLIKFNLI